MITRHLAAGTLLFAGALSLLPASASAETIRLGVTSGPHAQIAEALVPVAREQGLEVQIVEFSDGSLINTATADGDLDANAFQHTPYFEQQKADRGLDLTAAADRTVLLPMAGYSRRVASLDDLPDGAQVTIPADPSNGSRALKLLEAEGLITLREGLGYSATELDIADNPKNVRIVPMETAQLPRSLEDVDFSVITSHFALSAGLVPSRDALIIEDQLSEYFCLIAVKTEDADKPWVQTLVNAYKSPQVRQVIETTFEGNVVPGW